MLKNQELKVLTIQRIITITSSRKSMKFSFIRLYSKATTIQKTYNKNKFRLHPCGN